MITGGKSKFVSLLSLIKAERPRLYEVISDLCLDGTFRSQRYQNTFLLPNEALIKKIVDLVDKDEDIKAIDIIRSLLLNGHLKKEDFTKSANIATLQFGKHKLANPEEVAKHIKSSKMTIIATKENHYATVVYEYDGDMPKTETITGGAIGGRIPVGAVKGNWGENDHAKKVKEITADLIVEGNHKVTYKNFVKAVCGCLNILEKHPEKYNHAKYYLAGNAILSWFFLTMPGCSSALMTKDELNQLKWENVHPSKAILDKAMYAGGEMKTNSELYQQIKDYRNADGADRDSIVEAIRETYKAFQGNLKEMNAIDEAQAQNPELKMLMDELRFICESDDACSEESIDDTIAHLGSIKWNNPKESQIIFNSEIYKNDLLKCHEAVSSGPGLFMKSLYFVYFPPAKQIVEKLLAASGGNISGGNPAMVTRVIFNGGNAIKENEKHCASVKSLIAMLSADQIAELKQELGVTSAAD